MVVSAIVAASRNNVIGREGGLPWKLPDEMAFFKRTTMGHPVIMGRVTYESIGRALPGRQNIVITAQKGYRAVGCDVVGSIDEALKSAQSADEVFIIGGSQIYEEAMPKLDKIYLTRVNAGVEGDKFFDFDQSNWTKISSEHHPADDKHAFSFDLQVWERNE